MGLPDSNEEYHSYTDKIVYISARLAADPNTEVAAGIIERVLESIDEAERRLCKARREEVRARARLDHVDALGDKQLGRFRRQLDVYESGVFIRNRLFPRGLTQLTAPRGRAQVELLAKQRGALEDLLASDQLDAHEDAQELRAVLEGGEQMLDELMVELHDAACAWEQRNEDLARAGNLFRSRRSSGVAQLGVVMGELRTLLGSSSQTAYACTVPARPPSEPLDGLG